MCHHGAHGRGPERSQPAGTLLLYMRDPLAVAFRKCSICENEPRFFAKLTNAIDHDRVGRTPPSSCSVPGCTGPLFADAILADAVLVRACPFASLVFLCAAGVHVLCARINVPRSFESAKCGSATLRWSMVSSRRTRERLTSPSAETGAARRSTWLTSSTASRRSPYGEPCVRGICHLVACIPRVELACFIYCSG